MKFLQLYVLAASLLFRSVELILNAEEHRELVAKLTISENRQFPYGDMVTVSVSVIVKAIDVNEKESTVTVHGTLRLTWDDKRLIGPINFHSLDDESTAHSWMTPIHINPKKIWTPRIYVLNSANGVNGIHSAFHTRSYGARVYPTGTVVYETAVSITTTCTFDYSNFPHDEQYCHIKFAAPEHQFPLLTLEGYRSPRETWQDVQNYTGWALKSWNYSHHAAHDSGDPVEESEQCICTTETCVQEGEPCTCTATSCQAFLNVAMKIQRRSLMFSLVFYAPCITTSLLILASFTIRDDLMQIGAVVTSVFVQAFTAKSLFASLPPLGGKLPTIVTYTAFHLTMSLALVVVLVMMRSMRQSKHGHLKLALLTRFANFVVSTSRTFLKKHRAKKTNDNGVPKSEAVETTKDSYCILLFIIMLFYTLTYAVAMIVLVAKRS